MTLPKLAVDREIGSLPNVEIREARGESSEVRDGKPELAEKGQKGGSVIHLALTFVIDNQMVWRDDRTCPLRHAFGCRRCLRYRLPQEPAPSSLPICRLVGEHEFASACALGRRHLHDWQAAVCNLRRLGGRHDGSRH